MIEATELRAEIPAWATHEEERGEGKDGGKRRREEEEGREREEREETGRREAVFSLPFFFLV